MIGAILQGTRDQAVIVWGTAVAYPVLGLVAWLIEWRRVKR